MGENKFVREKNLIRNALTVQVPAMQALFVDESKNNVEEFMNQTTEQFEMIQKHLSWF